ncbi:MAG: signal peptidase [Actinomycetota bacterium]|nr:signal peptidase [Actinomycetota bacterium]
MSQRATLAVPETSTSPRRTPSGRVELTGVIPQALIVVTLLVAVVALDQAFKWWGWRHAPAAMINRGGSPFVTPTVDGWYADPATGARLDLLDVGLLSIAVSFLVLRRRSWIVLVPGAVMLGGWASNLLDRLGLHDWTAPGSVRGAVDFIDLGRIVVNVADAFIVVGTPLFVVVVSASYLGVWATTGSTAAFPVTGTTTRGRARTWTRILALTGAVGRAAAVGSARQPTVG